MSFKRYPEYVDSGVKWLGEVPKHWGVSLGRRLFVNRKQQSNSDDEQLAASQKHGVIPQQLLMELNDAKVMLALKGTESFRHVEKNDYVISLRSFEGGIEHSDYTGCVSPAYTVLQSIKQIHPKYYKYLFKSISFVSELQSTTDSLRDGKSITYQQFGSILIPIPTLPEQQAIATFLDRETAKIDALVEEQKRLIELLKEKRQAVISHAVTKGLDPNAKMKDSGVEWLGMVPEGWEVCGFTKYLDQIIDYRGKTPAKTEIGIQLITARNIKDGIIDYEISQEYIAEDDYSEVMSRGTPTIGDVLFTMEAPLGQVANVNRTDIALAQRIVKFRGKSGVINNYYLKYWIMSTGCQSQLEQLATGSTALGIKSSKLGQIQFCYPSIDEQTIIVKYLDESIKSFEGLMIEAQQAVDILQERRTALISAAVTGKIDVRDLTPNPSPERRGEHVGVSECYERG